MRKIMLSIALAASACFSDAGAQNPYVPGWVTIDVNLVDCVKATADDLLHFDGFGDEVYLVTFVSVANKSCATKDTTKFTLNVFGDRWRFPNRQLAGTVNPSTFFQGGITDGTRFAFRDVFLDLRRLRLELGDIVTTIPTVWEWDNGSNSQLQAAFDSRMLNFFQAINLRVAYTMENTGGRVYEIRGAGLGLPSFQAILRLLLSRPGSRPIGMTATGELASPIAIALNSLVLVQLRNNSILYSPSDASFMRDIAFTIDENALGNTSAHGVYRLRYTVAFEPDTSKPAAPAPAPAPAPASAPGRMPRAASETPGSRLITITSGIRANSANSDGTGHKPTSTACTHRPCRSG